MKSLPISLQDKALLNARNMADIGQIKEFSSLNLSKHRSVINAFVHIIAAITAYQINPFKPTRNLQQGNRVKPIKSFLRTTIALWVMFARRSVLLSKTRLKNRST